MKKTRMTWLAISVSLALAGCAHQSKVTPSTGHIDGQATQQNQKAAPTAAGAIPKPVKSTTYLPPPTPKAKEQTYSVVVNEVPVKEILFALARESNLNIDIHPAIQGRVTLNAVDQTLPAILERLAKQVDLTYKIENNVLSITPDHPVLRTYKIDYVNMSRDTKGFIGAAAEISSTGQSATTGSGGTSVTTSASGGANNSSRTSVTSESQNRFWENLEKNIKELLAETDKEVIITREGSPQSAQPVPSADGVTGALAAAISPANTTSSEDREKARAEYKTLFAATVISNRESGIITVRGTNKQHEKVREFIDVVMSSVKRQVLIEATIVEVTLNDGFQAGIDWSRLGNAGASSGFTFNQTLGPQITPGNTGFVAGYFNPVSGLGNIAASISLLKQFGDIKVLSSPKLMVLNNQTAVLKVVDNLVYFTIQAQQSTVGGSVGGTLATFTTTPNTVPVGIIMSVTPQITAAGLVNVNVRPTISRKIGDVLDPNPDIKAAGVESKIPVIQVREMESMLQIGSGSTAVLGGLMQDEIRKNTDKVPGLSDIPLAGNVFTGRNDSNSKSELVVFLRPTVIPDASLESDELLSYKQYLPTQQLQQSLDEPAY
ncbi:MAG: pilus (MSHA type) biogenesis protein MshL [Betaproteobacteria bacterium HGW-Betaproteobacteria-8]|nr:MAG: pilus (MSHA type) biogenesis protein MshL [Betaproteobacteria bacterium HGW-Betaproteobacteria-8]